MNHQREDAFSEIPVGTIDSETEAPATPSEDATQDTPLATMEIEMTSTGERRPRSKQERWLRELNLAIVDYPDSPTSYVLRGELALQTRDYGQAVADFEKALELAAVQVSEQNWGIVAQAMQDRAYAGLRQAKRRAHKRS